MAEARMLRQMYSKVCVFDVSRVSLRTPGLIRHAVAQNFLPRRGTIRCASHVAVSTEEPSGDRYKHILKTGPHTFKGDLGAEWGAGGTAPEPKDYAFAALAMCTSMTLRLYADRRKWPLKHVEVTVIEKGGGHGLLPDGLQMILKLEGDDLTEDQKKRLMEISKNCPVKQMFMGKMKDGVQMELAHVAELDSF